MNYRAHEPRPALRPWVRCIWELDDPSPVPRAERVLPDGCCEIVLNLADPFLRDGHAQPARLVVGQLERHLSIVPTGAVRLLGIRFEPGGLFALLRGADVGELTGGQAEIGALDRRLAAALEDAARRGVAAVEDALSDRLRPGDGLVHRAAAVIRRSGGRQRIGALARTLGVGERRLERAFAREVGLAPKVLARIERFQRVVTGVERTARLDWAGLAVACGYFDQAHLIRDFTAFAGITPGAYFVEEHPMSDCFTAASDSSNPSA
jgi:AraC-like DNA-binding protein